MRKECMLSTIDNPYDYFDQFIPWFLYDVEKGYNSCSILARLVQLTDDMSQKEKDEVIEQAIDKFLEHDFTNMRIKVTKVTGEGAPKT